MKTYYDVENVIQNKDWKEKSVNILWSGGCDSTCLLDTVLWTMKNNNDTRVVNAYSIISNQISESKMDYERTSRNKYLVHISGKDLPTIRNIEIKIDDFHVISSELGMMCPQPAIWISYIMPHIKNGVLFAGYHKGDCFFTHDIFENWLKVFDGLKYLYNKNIWFVTPYEHSTKEDIIRILIEKNIYNFTWWCEDPRNDKCGKCGPCKLNEMTYDFIMKHKYNKEPQLIRNNDPKEIFLSLKTTEIS